jgi:hypothetical protein
MRFFQDKAGFTCVMLLCLPMSQQASAADAQSPKQKGAMQSSGSDKAAAGSLTRAKGHAKKMPIEVVWGQSKRTEYFDRVSAPSEEIPKNGVVILNGTKKETRIFNSKVEKIGLTRNLPPDVIRIASSESKIHQGKSEPVVVGILSSGSKRGSSNAQPVVVNVASSESQGVGGSAAPVVVGIATTGSQVAGAVEPVAVGVSPRPAKRRPYRPAVLDKQ